MRVLVKLRLFTVSRSMGWQFLAQYECKSLIETSNAYILTALFLLQTRRTLERYKNFNFNNLFLINPPTHFLSNYLADSNAIIKTLNILIFYTPYASYVFYKLFLWSRGYV